MIKVVVCGALGKMGRTVIDEIAGEAGLSLAGAIEAAGNPGLGTKLAGVEVTADLENALGACDVVVDFTNPKAALEHIAQSAAAGRAAIVGTTGFTADELAIARRAAERIPLIISPNMSAGINLMFKIVENAARALADFDAEIVEIHHNKKKDSPSGTAAKLAEAIAKARPGSAVVHGREGLVGARKSGEIGMHSLRGGDVVGEHTVIFAGEGERFELTHRAHSRRTLARGTIRAIRFIHGKKPGLYTMADVLHLA
ncbi:MAG: 4-hydroxy-tetrahydrodipicolinate reductase [Candidatus Krumholzibacteria bacterium]|nr:4-hydroxy-tetrahydrodipicolinate reductase [Candidatus Krumholzibacteria bacterium]